MTVEVEVTVQTDFWQHSLPPVSAETWQQWLSQWLQLVATDLPPAASYELTLRFTNDPEIRHLNAQYRHQDKSTDVLAFAALETHSLHETAFFQSHPLYLGDIVISVETAERQAQQQRHSLTTELAWLVAHGCLHLLGWDHPDLDSFQRMIDQQVMLLEAVNVDIKIHPTSTLAYQSEMF